MATKELKGGAWRTIRGHHVYIKDGKIIAGGKYVVKTDKPGYTKNKSEQPRTTTDKVKTKGAGKSGQGKERSTHAGSHRHSTGTVQGRTEGRGQERKRDRSDSEATQLTIGKHTAKIKNTYHAENDSQYTFHELDSSGAEAFHAAISAAKEGNDHGAFVHAYEADEYKDMRTFISPGGEAGFAVKSDGDIVSVFRNPHVKDEKKGVAIHMLLIALQNGGKKLDCFDGYLPKLYAKVGMVPVAKLGFNREYAPEGWNYERDGEPDVVFMKHNGDDFETVLRKMKSKEYAEPDMDKVKRVEDYDDGTELQKSLMAKYKQDIIEKSLGNFQSFVKDWRM